MGEESEIMEEVREIMGEEGENMGVEREIMGEESEIMGEESEIMEEEREIKGVEMKSCERGENSWQRRVKSWLLLSCPPFTETLDVWPRLGTLQCPVICSHQIFLVVILPKIWTLEEVAHGLRRTTVAVYVLIFGITPLSHIDFAPTHPCAKLINGHHCHRPS